ncbi:unnamed protein product [Timema podura]|uniref:tRNA pseudouridine synthase n=1 Tax=Timema podura TaxID=61482 RepID=A0ABN7P2L8_TIMPD|nr:unnamed protein product [Timema podura]
MNSAARFIVGTHDFRNFCKMDVANGVVSFIRSIVSAQVSVMSRDPHMSADSGDTSGPRRSKSSLVPMGLASRSGVPGYDMCVLTLVGHAFLWHQVRCIMGLLLLVGQGKEEADVVQELLDVDSHPRKPQYSMASELPLNLFHCEYEQGTQWYMNQECLYASRAHTAEYLDQTLRKGFHGAGNVVGSGVLPGDPGVGADLLSTPGGPIQSVPTSTQETDLRIIAILSCYTSVLAYVVLTDSSQLTADGLEKLPDQIMELGDPHRALREETTVRGDGDGGSELALRRVFRLSWGWAPLVVSCTGGVIASTVVLRRPKVLVWSNDLDQKTAILVQLQEIFRDHKLGLLYLFVRRPRKRREEQTTQSVQVRGEDWLKDRGRWRHFTKLTRQQTGDSC